ncbi:hypothetical protein [Hyphomonas johnsonii]|uniref:Uncharacterized protein n=1 Tax=Hyphomonas johnsonii MHS-2 TaxID=1280950 RepID=A0A059FM92_9PROT|nr:hypothetical protein [Hyphomonas johnsonii]KCZ91641.1 hypothetical protein HJO_11007 [Hyphomonas johnsonii MHS-2]
MIEGKEANDPVTAGIDTTRPAASTHAPSEPTATASGISDHDVYAWQSIRQSVGVFDQLVMSLLTQGTVLVFAALGIIFGGTTADHPMMTIVLSFGVLFGVLMLHIGVSRYSTSITVAAGAARELEDRIWPDERLPNRVGNRLASHPMAAARLLGRAYYRAWSLSLLVMVTIVVLAFSAQILFPEWIPVLEEKLRSLL